MNGSLPTRTELPESTFSQISHLPLWQPPSLSQLYLHSLTEMGNLCSAQLNSMLGYIPLWVCTALPSAGVSLAGKVDFAVLEYTPGTDTPLGKLHSSPSLGQPAVPIESPAHDAWFHSWYQQLSQRHQRKGNPGWGRTQEFIAPFHRIISSWEGVERRHHTRDHQHVATVPGKYKALPYQGFTWAHENNVCVLLFDITRLALQGEELCEHVRNSFMQPKVSIWKLFNRQNSALNSHQVKVISVNKSTKNSKNDKSVWSYVYTE